MTRPLARTIHPESQGRFSHRHARIRRVVTVLGFLVLAVADPASAHNSLRSSSPTDGDQVAAAPAEWNVSFGEATNTVVSTLPVNPTEEISADTAASTSSGAAPEVVRWILRLIGFAVLMVIGGFLVGFGTRFAGGCTSGHTIMGLSNLQWPSLLATVGFFIGGLISTHLLLPFIFP